jgi:hypothetical protein
VSLNDFLDVIGVKASVILAGFGGSVARIAFFGVNGGVVNTLFAVAGGTITAIYLGPVGPGYLGWPSSGQATLAVTFIVGLFGMEICKQIGLAVGRWSPSVTAKGGKDV